MGADGAAYCSTLGLDEPIREGTNPHGHIPSVVLGESGELEIRPAPEAGGTLATILRLGLLFLLWANSPSGELPPARLIRKERNKHGTHRPALWSAPILDLRESSSPHGRPTPSSSADAMKRVTPHVRRGHFRTYFHKRFVNVRHRCTWIAPMRVGHDTA
jgi:hypothetical protein